MVKHILIVDDEELFREICQEMLEEYGYRVSVAEDVPSGMAIIQSDPVDLLVADITLPGVDGLTMIEQVRAIQPDLPTIVITGYLNQDNMLRSLNLGVQGFLTKPFFYDELFHSVEQAFKQATATHDQLLLSHYRPLIHLGEEILDPPNGEKGLDHTVHSVLKIALRHTEAVQGFVALSPAPGEPLRLAATRGFTASEQPRLPHYLGCLNAAEKDTGGTCTIDLGGGAKALAVPLPKGISYHGYLVLLAPDMHHPFSEEAQSLSDLLAVQTALALRHDARSAPHPTANRDQTAFELAAALLPASAGHLDGPGRTRSHRLAMTMACRLDLDDARPQAVADATALHDLGKAFIPPAILDKAAPLDPAEWETMRDFVNQGAHTLARMDTFRDAASLVRAHRERWDGSGYPRGLKGRDIPTGAQIVGAVTCWEAMRSDRPYRPRLPRKEAIQELRREAGRGFDPAVVEALLEQVAPPLKQHTQNG